MLRSMDVTPQLSGFQTVAGVDVRVRGESTSISTFQSATGPVHGLVVPRNELDLLIAQRARKAGSDWYEGCRVIGFEFEDGRASRVCYVKGMVLGVRTRFVVVADGGHSGLAEQAGISPRPAGTTGYAVRAYFSNVPAEQDLFRIYIPLTDPSSGRAVPGYGWVFPLKDSSANIGVGFYPSQNEDRGLNLRHLFTEFLRQLCSMDSRMADIRPESRWIGGPLRSGMDPSRCMASGALVVGDAAGLVDPFTGEGIDTALVSGQLAAEVLDTALRRDDPSLLSNYSDLLERRYRDRFQLGERFVKTYSFIWRMVQTTVDQRGPLFDRVRQGLFSYHGTVSNGSIEPPASPLDQFRNRVDVETKTVASSDFPVFARICLQMQNKQSAHLRQALAYWSYQFGGSEPDHDAVTVSACLELAKLAHNVQEQMIAGDFYPTVSNGETSRWANSFAIMSGNYLLMKAFSAIQRLGCDFTQLVARAAAQLCSTEIDNAVPSDDLTEDRSTKIRSEIEGLFCGLACKIASRLASCSEDLQESLERFGRLEGEASFWTTQPSGQVSAASLREQAVQALADVPNCSAKSELLAVCQESTGFGS
jgi:flavin-dependent dehydrogenase